MTAPRNQEAKSPGPELSCQMRRKVSSPSGLENRNKQMASSHELAVYASSAEELAVPGCSHEEAVYASPAEELAVPWCSHDETVYASPAEELAVPGCSHDETVYASSAEELAGPVGELPDVGLPHLPAQDKVHLNNDHCKCIHKCSLYCI